MKKKEMINLNAKQQEALSKAATRIMNRRGTTLSLKFRQGDIDKWRAAAEEAKKGITDWVEEALNKAVKKV